MKLTDGQIKMMQEDMYAELVLLIMEQKQCSMEQALGILYNSITFDRLSDARTGMYYQSPGHVYAYLQDEPSAA